MQLPVLALEQFGDEQETHAYHKNGIRYESDFRSPTKRSFLNECIWQIYILSGKGPWLPVIHSPIEFDKTQIWQAVNRLLQAATNKVTLQQVKRQLFRAAKVPTRKARRPQKRDVQRSELLYFKAVRFYIGVQKVRRGYLERSTAENYEAERALRISTAKGVFQVSPTILTDVCKHQKHVTRLHPYRQRLEDEQEKRNSDAQIRPQKSEELLLEEQYRKSFSGHENIMEESVRSVLYMKALFALLAEQAQQPNIYI